ncbi:hypothetical protein NL676_039792 [Syzygium grande]|nr:hypothetical protein NL676_039792 [Syzygium grande]
MNSGPIRGFEGLRHTNKNAVNWESRDKFAPDGEVSDPDSPSGNPTPVLTLVPEPEEEYEPKPEEESEPKPEEEPMAVEQGEEEENPIEIESDSESDSSASDSDWAPLGHLGVGPGGLFDRVPFCVISSLRSHQFPFDVEGGFNPSSLMYDHVNSS